ncbi:hypothetical protein GUJ93_ZPchr0009g1789 [Zizania palustris]|uniref:DUF7950 domain-containing protein n=1 Tax=Zizania palustris TaxID=103762 RepID=A0A8J5R4D2_ZIZPA|nr:hypothetical protein GUJ93_ZPchr0009g1789 [Zizania palustris]
MSWQMGKIMLRFRPIAPKPASMALAPTLAPVTTLCAGRGKRKAGNASGRKRGRKPKEAATSAAAANAQAPAAETVPKVGDSKEREREKEKSLLSPSSSSSEMTSVDSSPPSLPSATATMPLFCVPPVGKVQVVPAAEQPPPVALSAGGAVQAVTTPRALLSAAAVVTVEDVTSIWRDGESPYFAASAGAGDDDAPAFVSDQWGRVTWKNAAFHCAAAPEPAAPHQVQVALAAKGAAAALPAWGTCAGFTCRVRVQHARPRHGSLVAPCDVWCLHAGGGYLWRLDLQAALSLSVGPLP